MQLANTVRHAEAKVGMPRGLRAGPNLLVLLRHTSLQETTTISTEKLCHIKATTSWA